MRIQHLITWVTSVVLCWMMTPSVLCSEWISLEDRLVFCSECCLLLHACVVVGEMEVEWIHMLRWCDMTLLCFLVGIITRPWVHHAWQESWASCRVPWWRRDCLPQLITSERGERPTHHELCSVCSGKWAGATVPIFLSVFVYLNSSFLCSMQDYWL